MTIHYLIPLRHKYRAWYVPLQNEDDSSLTLAGLFEAWHGLTLKMNRHLKPELCPFKLKRGSIMPGMGFLILHIGPHRPVQGPLRLETLEWALSLTWDVPGLTRIGLSCEFRHEKAFLMSEVELT